MQTIKAQQLIHHNIPTPLSSVAFHHDVACIERFFAASFPMHLAIHRVSNVETPPPMYTEPHTHEVAEINIILGEVGGLEYAIQLGDDIYTVSPNSSVYIPAGMVHSANVLRGEGYFIAIRLDPVNDLLYKHLMPSETQATEPDLATV